MKKSLLGSFSLVCVVGLGGFAHNSLGLARVDDLGQVREASILDPTVSTDKPGRHSPGKMTFSHVSTASRVTAPSILEISPLALAHTPALESAPSGSTRLARAANLTTPSRNEGPVADRNDTNALTQNPQDQNAPKKNISQLLDVQSMIGPMNDAASTLTRAKQKTAWRDQMRLVPKGIRANAPDIDSNPTAYTWASPVFHHRPLYFEQPNLERYGNGPCRIAQPAMSSAHFLLSVPLIPLKMIHNPPWADVHTLGEGRPGDAVRMHSFHDVMLKE